MVSEQLIDDWEELARLIKHCSSGKWIFRGESSAKFKLLPKAGREDEYPGAARKVPYRLEDEFAALDLFKKQARPYLGHSPASDFEWLAIAQHHGMSTRLLDWTESLLVAAFFATEKAGTQGNAVIYGIDDLRIISEDKEKCPFELKSVGVYRPPHITPRIPAQRSVFTVHPDPTITFCNSVSFKYHISKEACGEIKRVLDTCAINESSLFPDIDGLSRYIGWRYKWGKF